MSKSKTNIRRLQSMGQIGVREPTRESMYDILKKNLELAERKTFLHRTIYIGKHTLPITGETATEPIVALFRNIVIKVNEDKWCLEKLTGFFFYFTNSEFIHFIEGDETAIRSHLQLLYKEDVIKHFEVIKLLIQVSHISHRVTPDWNCHCGYPKHMAFALNQNSTPKETAKYLQYCLVCIHNSIYESRRNSMTSETVERDESSGTGFVLEILKDETSSEKIRPSLSELSPAKKSESVSSNIDPLGRYLPEVELLTFLLHSPHTVKLDDYYLSFMEIYQREVTKDKMWPIPPDFIPFHVFELPDNPIIRFPRPKSPEDGSKQTDGEDELNDEAVEEFGSKVEFTK